MFEFLSQLFERVDKDARKGYVLGKSLFEMACAVNIQEVALWTSTGAIAILGKFVFPGYSITETGLKTIQYVGPVLVNNTSLGNIITTNYLRPKCFFCDSIQIGFTDIADIYCFSNALQQASERCVMVENNDEIFLLCYTGTLGSYGMQASRYLIKLHKRLYNSDSLCGAIPIFAMYYSLAMKTLHEKDGLFGKICRMQTKIRDIIDKEPQIDPVVLSSYLGMVSGQGVENIYVVDAPDRFRFLDI